MAVTSSTIPTAYIDFVYSGYQLSPDQIESRRVYDIKLREYTTNPTPTNLISLKEADRNFKNAIPYPFVLSSTEAIKNVLRIYLMSIKGDYGRNSNKGGPLYNYIGKPLNDTYKANIEKEITTSLNAIFSNLGSIAISVISVVATADITNKRWVIAVTFMDTKNKYFENFNIGLPGVV